MLHSVGVRWTSSPRGRRPPGREVDPEVRRLDHGLLVGRRMRAAQGGPQPGQQLVHAEGLRQVVVGAEVEGGDLVGLGLPHREHDDGHGRPAPEAADHVEPVDAGEAEVEEDDVGVAGRGQVERLLPAGRLVDVVAACLQVHGEGPPDLGLVVDDQHPSLAGHGAASGSEAVAGDGRSERDGHGQAAAGRVVDADLAVHRRHEAVGDGQPEADARIRRAVTEAPEGLEDAGPLRARDARPTVDDPEADPLLDRRGLDAHGLVAGRPGQRVGHDVGHGPLQERGVGLDERDGLRDVDGRAVRVVGEAARAPPRRRPPTPPGRSAGSMPRSAAGSCPGGWRRRGRAGPSRCRSSRGGPRARRCSTPRPAGAGSSPRP